MKKYNKKICLMLFAVFVSILLAEPCLAKRVIIPVTGKVNSFGAYSYIGKLKFNVTKPGEQEIGQISIEGTYNGEYPWIMRIYTDNTNYTGISGAAGKSNPAGLISTDGRFALPLFANSPNFGIEQYKIVPDINQAGYETYIPDKLDEKISPYTDCIIMANDPRNELWVAGTDGALFTDDDNALGDTTLKTPFIIKFKSIFDARAVTANYTANLYIEIVSCP